eukprot:9851778-Lingulodinium_polyedra.AAC.1
MLEFKANRLCRLTPNRLDASAPAFQLMNVNIRYVFSRAEVVWLVCVCTKVEMSLHLCAPQRGQ